MAHVSRVALVHWPSLSLHALGHACSGTDATIGHTWSLVQSQELSQPRAGPPDEATGPTSGRVVKQGSASPVRSRFFLPSEARVGIAARCMHSGVPGSVSHVGVAMPRQRRLRSSDLDHAALLRTAGVCVSRDCEKREWQALPLICSHVSGLS